MIYLTQDITAVTGPAIILHGVNCQGVMGAGVAKAISDKWPKVRERYLRFPAKLGAINIIKVEPDIVVINCYTQEFYGNDGAKYASPDAIYECLLKVITISYLTLRKGPPPKIYAPKIGCGLGGLNWETEVKGVFQASEIIWKSCKVEFNICEI